MNIISRYSMPLVFGVFSCSAHAFDFTRLMAVPEVQQMMPRIQGLMKNRQVQGMMRQVAPMMSGSGGGIGGFSSCSSARNMASVDRADSDFETQLNDSYYVRTGPGTAYRQIGTVGDFEGAGKPTGKRSGKWVEVKFENGKRGWVSAKAVSRVAKKEAPAEKSAVAQSAPSSEKVEPQANQETEETQSQAQDSVPAKEPKPVEKVAKQDGVKEDLAAAEQAPKVESTKPTAQSTKIIDKSKPQCAENQAELDANANLKTKLNGYNPFAGWAGGRADIVQNPETGKMQVEVKPKWAGMAESFGFKRVNPTDMKVCIDSEEGSPYLFVGGKKYDRMPTSVKLGSGFQSETFKIQTSR